MSNDKETFDPRFDPAFQPGFEGKIAPATKVNKRDVAPALAALEAARAGAVEPVAAQESAAETTRRPNPFLIALAVISVALIAGGLSAMQSLRATFTTENISTSIDYMTLQMVIYAAPLAVAVGILIGVGVLFIYAVNWSKRA
jgi:hypothetical protein